MTMVLILQVLLSFFSINYSQAHELRVAIIDTGLNLKDPRFAKVLCKDGHKDFTGLGITDTYGHGTHIAGLIKTFALNSNYCLMILKYYSPIRSGFANANSEIEALKWATTHGADIVNISAGGDIQLVEEFKTIKSFPNVQIDAAAGNNGSLFVWYPCAYNLPNVKCVGSVDNHGHRSFTSNYGPTVHYWEPGENVYSTKIVGYGKMSGTSQATAIFTGLEVLRRSTK